MDNAQRVLEGIQASAFIGKFVRLKPLQNRQFIGICPFHNEKSPSFRVNDDKKFFYCFGCNKGGNILNFLQDYKNISFIEALNEIALEYNIKLEKFNTKAKEDQKEKEDFLEEVSNIFTSQLYASVGMEALKYLQQQRKVSNETIKHFKLGFCPKEADFLISYFPNKIEDLINLGLIGKRGNGEFYSTFNDRIIFPILNIKNKVIAFGSRIYKKSQEEAGLAKYINSKESDIFKKSKVIYGLEKAKQSKAKPIVVEGYFDVITMHAYGFNSAVAAMGTAFSEEHIQNLFSLSNEIIFCYDSDDAGKKAEKRSIELALPALTPETNISFISLEAKDCDEFLNLYGKEKMQEKVENRTPLYKKIFNDYKEGVDFENPAQTSILEHNLIKFCEKITNIVLRKNYQNYFKNQLFQAKSIKKRIKKENYLKLEKTDIKPRDALLFNLFMKFPEILNTDFYLENFVPFTDKKLETELKTLIKSPASYSKIYDNILANYSIKEPKNLQEAEDFYKKIYNQYLTEKLQQDIANCLIKQDFAKAKSLKEELAKLKNSGL